MSRNKGKLYLLPSLLGDCIPGKVIPPYNLIIIHKLRYFIVEEPRTARRYLKKIYPELDLNEIHFSIYNEHTDNSELFSFINPLIEGNDIGLLSEAGSPCIADPGSQIVRLAHENSIDVIPLVGPSSLLLALMASGFNGQNFCFHGYLPVDKHERAKKIKELETSIYVKDQTQIFIETPYRNIQVFKSILDICKNETCLCLAVDLTSGSERIVTKTIRDWKKMQPDIHKRPAVFLLFK